MKTGNIRATKSIKVDVDPTENIGVGNREYNDNRYCTESEVDTISGTLQTSIDDMPVTLLELTDTPTTYSGAVGNYLRTTFSGIDFFEPFSPERMVYVAKNGSDASINGGSDTPFLTIQAGIDYIYTTYGPITDTSNKAVVLVAPGKYTEQIHSYDNIIITSYASGWDSTHTEPSVTLYNTGADSAHYPLRSDEDESFEMIGINIETDASGVVGKMPWGSFRNCRFNYGDFVETNRFILFICSSCTFRYAEHSGFNLTGTNLVGMRILLLYKCKYEHNLTCNFASTHDSSSSIRMTDCEIAGTVDIGGDWHLTLNKSNVYRHLRRNIIDTTGSLSVIDSSLVNGLHFTSAPSLFTMINSSFKGFGSSRIPDGEGDITSDVPITNSNYSNNIQYNGLDGEIQIINSTKRVGYGLTDSYKTLTEAVKASSSGDIIFIGSQIFTENIILPAYVSIKGENYNTSILTSTSGTTLTLGDSGINNIHDLTISSTPSGVLGASALKIQGCDSIFKNCVISSTATETYGTTVDVTGGDMECRSSRFIYTNEVSGGGEHRLFTISGGGVCIHDSHFDVDIEDASDNAYVINDHTEEIINITRNHIVLNTVSSGTTAFIKQDLNESRNNILYNYIELSGTQGTGVCYLISDDSGDINSTDNSIKLTGFDNNYLGVIGNNTGLKSHFDSITAVDGVIGNGTYSFVNSPDPGDIRISGAYINMYDNDIVVAKRGGEFDSIKDAVDSITDNSSTNRYNIHVHSGFYTEDNPIELKPYVYISGQFKHNPRIIPANSLEHLFVLPTGYCTCDLGELTLQAPAGDNSHQVYLVYSGPGCKPIMGIYQCLFLGDNIDYCNGFHNEELLSGYHTVNCMTYGSFNTFAHMSGGNWTDSGFIPEATTAVKYYLYMDGAGIAIIDLMRAKCPNFEKMFYINNANAELIVSDIYAEDQRTLITGPNGGKVRMRGSTFHGKNEFDAGEITIHGGTFDNNSYVEALTGNLEFLSITSTKNKNEVTYCVRAVGGGSTEIYIGGGNIFDSPNGVQSVQLEGSFSNVQVEGVRQYNIATLLDGESTIVEHLPDLDYSRIIQVQAFPGMPGVAEIEYLTVNENSYIQEDSSKTAFIDNKVTLSGVGLVAYAHWHWNETTGKDVYDSSGFGRDGLGNKTDNADWIAGKLNNCMKIDSNDEYVSFGNIASWDRTDSFSIDCWFYTTTDTQMYVLSKMENVTGKGYGFYLNARKPYFVLGNNITTNKIEVYSDEAVSSGAWHHGVFTYDGSSTASGINIYIDGDNKTLTSVSDALSATIINTADFQMSGRDGANLVFNYGQIDEVVLYEKEITLAEVEYRYNGGSGTESIVCTHNIDKGWYVTTASGSNFDNSIWTNIAQMVFTESLPQYTQIRYLISVDERNTWKYWDSSAWSNTALSGIDDYGNSSDILEGLSTNSWDTLCTTSSGTCDIAASLKTTSSCSAPVLDKIEVVYSTPGARLKIGDSDLVIEYTDETTTKITNNSGNTLTGIKCNILKIQPY